MRTLDVTRPSGDLLADSTAALRVPDGADCLRLQLTADGKTVLCGAYAGNTRRKSTANAPMLRAYSVATGKSRLVYQLEGTYELGLRNAGLLTKGTFTPVRFPLNGPPYAGEIAF